MTDYKIFEKLSYKGLGSNKKKSRPAGRPETQLLLFSLGFPPETQLFNYFILPHNLLTLYL